ncbi:hypothetical protein ACFC08_38505 [Streptomyces sp. NPDC056112]|nr:hypothetical protein [Streptomyces sp. HYC2]
MNSADVVLGTYKDIDRAAALLADQPEGFVDPDAVREGRRLA